MASLRERDTIGFPCFIVLLFTLAQAIIIILFGYTPYPDGDSYIDLAKECVSHREFYPIGSQIDKYPFLWNMGAINAVALSFFLFGSFTPLLYFYCILKGMTAMLVYLISKQVFNYRIAFWALIIYVFYPANYGEATSVLSEIPFIFLGLLSIYFGIKRHFFMSGLILVVANYFRPMAIMFVFPLFIYWYCQHQVTKSSCLKYILGATLMLLIIGCSNYSKTGYFIIQAKTGWMALRDYSMDHSNDNIIEASSIEQKTEVSDIDSMNCIEVDAEYQRQFLHWLKEHPATYFKQMPMKIIRTYISDNVNFCAFLPNKNVAFLYEDLSLPSLAKSFPRYNTVQILTLGNLIYYYILMIGFVVFSFDLCRNRLYWWVSFCFCVPLIGTLILVFVGHGETRFHIPFMPFIIMLIAAGLYKRWQLRNPINLR